MIKKRGTFSGIVMALAVLTPKCPLCGVVYCGVASATGLAVLPDDRWVFWTMAGLLALVTGLQAGQAFRHGTHGSFWIGLAGVLLVGVEKIWTGAPGWMAYAGLALILMGAILPERFLRWRGMPAWMNTGTGGRRDGSCLPATPSPER